MHADGYNGDSLLYTHTCACRWLAHSTQCNTDNTNQTPKYFTYMFICMALWSVYEGRVCYDVRCRNVLTVFAAHFHFILLGCGLAKIEKCFKLFLFFQLLKCGKKRCQ